MLILYHLTVAAASLSASISAEKHSIDLELKKRSFHDENPLIYMADDHPLEFYWLRPYYPSRKFPNPNFSLSSTNTSHKWPLGARVAKSPPEG